MTNCEVREKTNKMQQSDVYYQHCLCSPEDGHNDARNMLRDGVDNKHLTVTSCWFSLSLHNLLTMHGHRKLKFEKRNEFFFQQYSV